MKNVFSWNKPTKIGLFIALPFALLASYSWLVGPKLTVAFEAYWFGDQVYKLGYPLTGLVLYFPKYSGRYLTPSDHWWALPFINILFIFQWIIWSHAVAFFLRKIRK